MKLDDLEAKAKAATPGPWVADRDQVKTAPMPNSIRADIPMVCPAGRYESDPVLRSEDAAFIAAASPDVVLKLIDRIRELEDHVVARQNMIDGLLRRL